MKKLLAIMLLTMLLAGCGGAVPTLTDIEMQTKVAKILTEMPTETVQPLKLTPPTPLVEVQTPVPSDTPMRRFDLTLTAMAISTDDTPTITSTEETEPTSEAPVEITETTMPTDTPEPTATPPKGDPAILLGIPAWSDPMDNGKFWGTEPSDFTTVTFKNGYMRLNGLKQAAGWRLAGTASIGDGYIELTANSGDCSGRDYYGIIFHVPSLAEADRGYRFGVSCDGYYTMDLWDGKAPPAGHSKFLVSWRPINTYFNPGANQVNRIAVKTKLDEITLYINGYYQGFRVWDSTYPGGNFGVFVRPTASEKYTVLVDKMSYWQVP